MVKHSSVLLVVSLTQHSQPRIKLLALKRKAKSILVLEIENEKSNMLTRMTLDTIWCLKGVFH